MCNSATTGKRSPNVVNPIIEEIISNTVNQNAVVQTYWKLTGTDEELITEEGKNSGTFSGATPFTTTTMPPGTEFVPFADLTEEMVISWIQAVVEGNPGYKQHIDEQIQKQIDQKEDQIKLTPL